jgi:hypothetical protein
MLMMVKGKLHPWMSLALAIVAGAALLVFLLKDPRKSAGPVTAAAPGVAESAPLPRITPANAPQPGTVMAPQALEAFKRNLRRSLLHQFRFDWMDASTGRDLFLAGHTREAFAQAERELGRRVANGDRDAAVRLFGLRSGCNDPDFLDTQRDLVENASRTKSQVEALALKLPPAKRARAEAAIEIDAEAGEIVASFCREPAAMDNRELEDKVREAASDGHTPSLTALAAIAAWKRDDVARERYLLSASLLGDADAQVSLASVYRQRLAADPQSKDRGKMRFWLEQAYDKVPGAAYDLGMCFRSECDGLPANPDRAQQLIESAAHRGDEQALWALTHATDGSAGGDKFGPYVWTDFKTRLAETGCEPDASFAILIGDDRTRARSSLYPNDQAEADRRADEFFAKYGPAARAAAGCN